MLNEIIEASEYLYDVKNTNPKPERIKRTILLKKNEFLGLEHILTVVARYFIYEDDVDYEDGLKRAEAAIRMWCGHLSDNRDEDDLSKEYEYLKENYPWIDYWLPEYLREMVSKEDEDAMEKVESGIKALSDKKKYYSVSSLNKQPNENDFKAIRYDKTIANAAVCRGPLRIYYLVCKNSEWQKGLRGKAGKVLTPRLQDRVLKTIAAYMIERSLKLRKDEAPRYERVNLKDVAYWSVMDTRLDSGHYSDFTVFGRPLFHFQSGLSGNLVKAKPDTEWFNDCGWGLIEATKNDSNLDAFLDNNPEAIFYSDLGGGVSLERNIRYVR